jgi:ferredoxin
MMVVACSSIEAGKDVRKMCQVGCIACGICAKQSDVFLVNNNLARADHEKYQPDEKAEAAYTKCPTCVIVYRGKNAPAPRTKEKKPAAAKA